MKLNPKRERILRSRYLAGRVTRYHTAMMHHKPCVAESSARVATLYCELWGLPRAEVLYYILKHDDGEHLAGDTPFTAKRLMSELASCLNAVEMIGLEKQGVKMPELTDAEFSMFKIADLLEMWECGCVEVAMGNTFAETLVEDALSAAMMVAGTADDRGYRYAFTKGDVTNAMTLTSRVNYWVREQTNAD